MRLGFERLCIVVVLGVLVVFVLNIMLGKAKIEFGLNIPFLLGDLAEFLTLLGACAVFTLVALHRERHARRRDAHSNETGNQD